MGFLSDFAESTGFADLWHGFTGADVSLKNIDMQKDINNQNMALTRESWSRDDNAVQRRVADLTAAGLSPTLAAGSAAGNSSPIEMKAPQGTVSPSPLAAIGPAIEVATAVTNIARQAAEVQKTKAETVSKLAEANYANDYYSARWLNTRSMEKLNSSRYVNQSMHNDMLRNALDITGEVDWSTLLKKTQYEYMKKQLDIFNNTGVDMRTSYGLGNILKLIFPDLSDAVDKHGGK